MMTQDQFKTLALPFLKEKGTIYRKSKNIYAKAALDGEIINTVTSDGMETQNVAEKGDFIVKNQTASAELYIVKNEAFQKRYKLLEKNEDGFSEYQSLGKVRALVFEGNLIDDFNLGREFYFVASWGEKTIIKENDFIVCPLDYNEVYRIARKEFFETYKPDE